METNPQDYRISFFKPTTPIALYNRNLVIWLVSIWAVAIFGFQILLKVMEKPTPEAAYNQYETVWDQVSGENATTSELQTFAQTCLSVLGKNFIHPGEKEALNQALTWSLFQLAPPERHAAISNEITAFKELTKSISNITDSEYVRAKVNLSLSVSPLLGLDRNDVRTKLVSAQLLSEGWNEFPEEVKAMIPSIMSKYLIHNQSVLTDIKFLGFPFHYFYTSIFLLILFVGLCWLYCIRIDRRNIVLGIPE